MLSPIHVLGLVQVEEQPGCVRPKAFVDHFLVELLQCIVDTCGVWPPARIRQTRAWFWQPRPVWIHWDAQVVDAKAPLT